MGPGGALVESAVPLSPRTRLTGRLSVDDRQYQVRVEVCHVRPGGPGIRGINDGRYVAGLQWIDSSAPIVEALAIDAAGASEERVEGDRRMSRRTTDASGWNLTLCVSTSAGVVDISTSGVLFSSKIPLDPGSTAVLKLRFGQDDFAGDIEVRRLESPAAGEWRMGAVFSSVNDKSLESLERLLAPKS